MATDNRKTALGSKYRVEKWSYPEGLGVNPDLQHYVAFYINIRGKSQMVTQGNNTDDYFKLDAYTGQNRIDPNSAGKAVGRTVAAQGLGATLLNVLGTKGNKTKANPGGISSGRAKGRALKGGVFGTAATVFGAKLAQSTPLLKPDQTYRLKDVITLHVEERPSVKYSASYANREMGSLAGAMAGGGSATDSTKTGGPWGEYAALAGQQIAKIPGAVGAGQAASLMQLSAKVTTNPFKEVFFESVDFRTFNFRYKFFPRSQAEVTKVQDIIDTFKYHMHPELSRDGLFYVYPSEFEIVYYYRESENENVHRISTCALTDMSVEYGGEQFSTFRDGSPVETTVTLTFKELETMHKDRVAEGY